MRLAVAIAASSVAESKLDADDTLPPVLPQGGSRPQAGTSDDDLSASLRALGFSVVRVPLVDATESLEAALVGLEPADTLLVHISGVLGMRGVIDTSDGSLPLELVAEALAERPCAHALVLVEVAYRGEADALVAVEKVEGVTDALAAPGDRTIVVGVHPVPASDSNGTGNLTFTHALFAAAREVARPDGTADLLAAYTHARKQRGGVAASAYAFLRGEAEFELARGLSMPPVAEPITEARAEPVTDIVAVPTQPEFVAAPSEPDVAESAPLTAPAAPVTSPYGEDADDHDASEALVAQDDEPEPSTSPFGWSDDGSESLAVSAHEFMEARIAAASESGNHRLAVQLSRERLPSLPDAESRVDELFEIGRTLVAKLHDLPEAVAALEEARGIDSTRSDVLEALRRAYNRLERWTESLEVTLSLAKLTEAPRERASYRVAAAQLASEHIDDEEYALELLAAALEDDPTHEGALGELVRIRRWRGDLVDLEQTLASIADRLVLAGDAARAWDACQRLASLRRDDLGDPAGAVEALAIAKRLPLSELDSRAVLAEQLLALDDDDGAVAELDAIVMAAPLHARAHARLFAIHTRAGHQDRAYLTALALEELGEADGAARGLLDAYRADWGLRARTSLDEPAWQSIRAAGSDETIDAVFRACLRAAIAGQFEDKAKRPVLDPSRRQSSKSTGSIVRCFHWAARALGIACPELYVLDEVKGGIAAVSAPEPTTALGPDVLRGISSKTLAFLAGRHLTYFRPEYQVLVHFPTAEAAAGLFFAAVELVAPGTFVPSNLALRVASLRTRLARHLRPEELAAISAAVGMLEAREAKVDLLGWIRSVELTAGRAGLLLAGDLQTALGQVRSEIRGLSGLSIEERRQDLLAFCSSKTLAELRATFADTTPSSMRPPTMESGVVRSDDARLREPQSRPPMRPEAGAALTA